LAIAAQVALVCWLPLAVVGIVVGLDQRSLVQRIQHQPFSLSVADLRASDHRVDVVNGILFWCLLATGIVFIAWFRRAYRNLDGLGASRRFGAGWSVGAWFVPFLNLVRPKQIADEIWAASDLRRIAGTQSVRTPDEEETTSGLILAWWAAWVSSSVVAFIARRDPRTLDDVLRSNTLYLIRNGLLAVAAVLAIFVVRRITAGQAARADAPASRLTAT
jgi:hypothetical protein